jgi:hypothetical protein
MLAVWRVNDDIRIEESYELPPTNYPRVTPREVFLFFIADLFC